MPPKAKQATCDVCRKVVAARDKAISCVGCVAYRHVKCFTPVITDEAFAMLQGLVGFEFRCGHCPTVPPVPSTPITENAPTDQNTVLAALAQAINGINATLKEFGNRLASLEARVNSAPPPPTNETDLNELMQEAIMQHENRSQLVIKGVPESVDATAYAISLFDHLEIDDYQIVEAYRMGKQQNDDSTDEENDEEGTPADKPAKQPRLVKVRLARAQQRDRVLSSARKLKDSTQFPVFVRPSYTIKERRQISQLYDRKNEMESTQGRPFYIKRAGPISEWSIEPALLRPKKNPHQPHSHHLNSSKK